MGIRVIDPEDPAGYDCTYTHSKNNNTPSSNCTCSCCIDSNSSSDSSSSTSTSYSSSSICSCARSHKITPPTLTLTFANNNNNTASNYHYCKTEMLQTPLNSKPITHSIKDLVGNSKEYRIENNKCDLRIIGNSNRIRIGCNQGNLQIIGNSTRLKITNNTGKIRYTGNEGRICLGSDSTQQIVDYIGNNGKLKVVKAAELLSEKSKNHQQKIPNESEATVTMFTTTMTTAAGTEKKCAASAKTTANVTTTTTATAKTLFPSCSTPKKAKVKSASFAGDYSARWRQFNELFKRHDLRKFDSTSMPNLKNEAEHKIDVGVSEKAEKNFKNGKGSNKCCKIDNNINIVNTYGNICIKNAVNVNM